VRSPFVWPERWARFALRRRHSRRRPNAHTPLSLRRVEVVMKELGFGSVATRFSPPVTLVGNFCIPPSLLLRRLSLASTYPFARSLANTWIALFRKTVRPTVPPAV